MLHVKQCSEWISSEVIWQAMTLRSGPLRKRRDFPGLTPLEKPRLPLFLETLPLRLSFSLLFLCSLLFFLPLSFSFSFSLFFPFFSLAVFENFAGLVPVKIFSWALCDGAVSSPSLVLFSG